MKNSTAYKSQKARDKTLVSYDEFLQYWPVPYQSQYIFTSFGETHVLISGSTTSKPLVLLHGAAGNSCMWFYNIAALSKQFRVIAVDIIGEPGKSAGTRPLYKSEDYSHWLKEVLENFDIKNAALCGLSLGAMLAYRYALCYPESVSSLALLAPPLANQSFAVMYRAVLANLFPKMFAMKFLNYISASAVQWPEWGVKAFIVPYHAYKFNFDKVPLMHEYDLSKLPEKTLILLGKQEVLCNPAEVVLNMNSINVDIIPGAKHTINADQPAIVNARLLDFLC